MNCINCGKLGSLPYRKGVCNTCYQRKRNKAHYIPGRIPEWVKAHPERVMWLAARHKAKQQGVPFTIKASDIVIPKMCPILGIPLQSRGKSRDVAPSLDKVIPELGYVPGNIAVISNRANRIKSDSTQEELEKILQYVKQFNTKT